MLPPKSTIEPHPYSVGSWRFLPPIRFITLKNGWAPWRSCLIEKTIGQFKDDVARAVAQKKEAATRYENLFVENALLGT